MQWVLLHQRFSWLFVYCVLCWSVCYAVVIVSFLLQLAGSIVDILMLHIDKLSAQQTKTERRLEQERMRVQL